MEKIGSLILILCFFWSTICYAEPAGSVGADNSRLNYKVGTIPARANASAPAWGEANSVPLSVDLSGNLRTTEQSYNSVVNITTNTTTVIKNGTGTFGNIIVNTGGTASTVAFYSIASGGCTGTPVSGYLFTLPTVNPGGMAVTFSEYGLGLCAVTAGTAAANISILYR